MVSLKTVSVLLLFGLAPVAHAAEVRCSIAVSDGALMRINYQVDKSGAATSKASYQVFYDNGFAAQQSLDISKSEIDQANDVIRMNAGDHDVDGNTISFEATLRGGMDAYSGIARGILKGESFKRLIVCSLVGT